MARLTLALCAALASAAAAADVPRSWLTDAGDADRVYNLPGMPAGGPDSTLYAGYVDITPTPNGRSLFYTFQTSAGNPQTDPLVLWLNGALSQRSSRGAQHGDSASGSAPCA